MLPTFRMKRATSGRLWIQTRCLSQTPHPEANHHNEVKEFPKNYTHYQILGIPPTADAKQVKAAFRKLSKRFHPDMNQRIPTALKPIVKNNYIRIVASYETLSDTSKRSQYDSKIKTLTRRTQGPQQQSHDSPTHPRKTYSTGGINITRNRVHYGAGYKAARTPYADIHSRPSGSNYDVPHFDFDSHLRGNLRLEKRLISKRFIKTRQSSDEWFKERFTSKQKPSIQTEINETLNLQRYGGHSYRSQQSYTISAGPTAALLAVCSVLSMGIYLH